MDNLDVATRSKVMASIKGKSNKTTERRFRAGLIKSGITGWVVHPQNIIGNPDFIFPNERIAIFVDGCFWHGCPRCKRSNPGTHRYFWKKKIKKNCQRDMKVKKELRKQGWIVVRYWEHDLKHELKKCISEIIQLIQ